MKRVKTALLFNDKYKQGYSYIMANPTTTEEWKQVAANAQAQIDAVNLQRKQGEQQITALEQQLLAQNQKISEYLAANPIYNKTTLNALEAEKTAITKNLDKTTVYVRSTLVSQVFQLRATINNANTQAGVASSGAPDTSTNTPPETTVPNQSNTTVTTTTIPVPAAQLNSNTDPNTNIGAEIQTPTPQQPINPNNDPNTNIGTEAQDFVFEPLQEPPPTEVDEFTGIDEQVERQRQIDDGTLEFAGIDEQVERQRQIDDGTLEFAGIDQQIANNENALQEPPQLSDEEVDSYIRQAGQQDEIITSPNSITESVFDPSGNNGAPAAEESVFDPTGNQGAPRGLSTSLADTRSQATAQDVANFQAKPDWRVRLSLAPGATYLYKNKATSGILAPLAATDGVIFPYTPAISVQYAASYDPTELTHSNYKFFTYRGSSVDSITISCDFTAQDTFEANYLLAVIHFFRSVTKMFYGQDQNPKIGTPPPLCYLSGLGAFQFDAHPLAITSFNYTLPTDVDYIRAGSTPTPAGVNLSPATTPNNSSTISEVRRGTLGNGGTIQPAQFTTPPGSRDVTYVPTKMQISIQAVPIVTRNDISNKFSLTEYGTGKLLRGTQRQGGGIW